MPEVQALTGSEYAASQWQYSAGQLHSLATRQLTVGVAYGARGESGAGASGGGGGGELPGGTGAGGDGGNEFTAGTRRVAQSQRCVLTEE